MYIFLDDPQDISLGDVFVFMTGSDTVPLHGFDKQPVIIFYSDPGRLPNASTCVPALRLPRYLTEYADFKEKIREAILGSAGFGNV